MVFRNFCALILRKRLGRTFFFLPASDRRARFANPLDMGICSAITSALFEYNTSKIVHIKSKTIGIVNRLIQATIICYVIIFVIIYKKGYQEQEIPYSSVTTKLKGTAITNLTGHNVSLPLYGGIHVWDSSDYVVPAEEKDEFFVMTNMIISPNQTQGTCPEDPNLSHCTNDTDCTPLEEVQYGHGFKTGKCVESDRANTKVCEIYGWCPVEIDETPMPGFNLRPDVPLIDIRNFTVLIKNTVQFPTFGESKRNIDPDSDSSYLKSCHYHKEKDPLCPIIKLGTIIQDAGADFDQITFKGGVVAIIITWDCDFDSLTYSCQPQYSFRRLDSVKTPIAGGYNFRYATKFVQDGELHRTMMKAYGVRFVILVYGQGGKFSVVPLFLNLGSGLALLGLATVLCDLVVLYLVPKKLYYREKKYDVIDEEKLLLSGKEKQLPSYTNQRNDSFQDS